MAGPDSDSCRCSWVTDSHSNVLLQAVPCRIVLGIPHPLLMGMRTWCLVTLSTHGPQNPMHMLVPVQHEEAEQSFGVLSVFFSSEVFPGFQVLQCYALRKCGSKEKAVDENATGSLVWEQRWTMEVWEGWNHIPRQEADTSLGLSYPVKQEVIVGELD